MLEKLTGFIERLRAVVEEAKARRRGDERVREPGRSGATDYYQDYRPRDPAPPPRHPPPVELHLREPVSPIRSDPGAAGRRYPHSPGLDGAALREELADPQGLRRLVVIREILDPPLALRPRGRRRFRGPHRGTW